MLSPYGDGVGDAESKHTPPKGKVIIIDGDLDMCLSLMVLCDSIIGSRSFCLDPITDLFLKDKLVMISAIIDLLLKDKLTMISVNHALLKHLDFSFVVYFGDLWLCFVSVTFEIFFYISVW